MVFFNSKKDGTFDSELIDAWNAVDLLLANINKIINSHNFNPLDITLIGFSQGAILSWALAYKKSNKIRRIVALSGFVHDSIDISIKPSFLAYASHGINDIVIPVERARKSILPISKKYTEIEYHEFMDGHNVSRENLTLFLKWIEKTNF